MMENYEQMFKEITRKLYGDSEIETIVVNYEVLPKTATSSTSTDESLLPDSDCWIASDENIPWTKSKIASYNSAQKLFRCTDCECVGLLTRIAEHWLGTHANIRIFQCSQCSYSSAWARCVRMHLAQQHNVTTDQSINAEEALWKENPILDEVTAFLKRLKAKVDNDIFPSVTVKDETRENEAELTIDVPTGIPDEVPSELSNNLEPPKETVTLKTPTIRSEDAASNTTPAKRYNCNYCSYGTDRRDLFNRHENIHRDIKPFHCYVCLKQFTRADHVKKHFVRIHRELTYNISRIKREAKDDMNTLFVQVPQRVVEPNIPKTTVNIISIQQPCPGGDQSSQTRPEDKKYSCSYCPWSGMGNWCLKRHLNTHLKPFGCHLCDYKAARAERLATHVFKVHKKNCDKCSFVTEDDSQLTAHVQQEHL